MDGLCTHDWFIVWASTILSTLFSILKSSLCCFEGAPLKIPLGSTVYHLLIKQCVCCACYEHVRCHS